MSLTKAKTRVKEGIGELQSATGLKKVAVNFGIGVAIGTIADLILEFIMVNLVKPMVGDNATKLWGFSIFPKTATNPETGKIEGWMAYDDILLIIVTILLLMSKKLWLVLGFFTGWYFSSYFGLYQLLGLPEPTEPPPP